MPDDKLVVRFHPRLWEMFLATLVLLVGICELLPGVVPLFWKPTTNIACDRATCHLTWKSIFGTPNEFTLEVANLRDSRIRAKQRGESEWIVTNKDKPYQIGPLTDQDDLLAAYKRLAPDFDAFLKDPTRPSFTGSFVGSGGPSIAVFLIMGVLVTAWGIKWRRGWRAELEFDKVGGALTIKQRPWMRPRTIPLADIRDIDASDRIMHSTHGNFRWEDIAIRGVDGAVLWRYRTMFTRKTYQHVQDSVHAMRQFLASR